MENAVVLEKQEENFTRFPEQIQNYFLKKKIVINLYPNDITSEQESNIRSFNVTSAEQFCDYIDEEIAFWTQNDPSKKLEDIAHYSYFKNAKNYFNNALNSLSSPNSIENYLNQSINAIASATLSSKTKLTKELLKHINKSTYFMTGFKAGMLINGTNSFYATPDTFQGFYAAMAYRNIFNICALSSEETISEFKANAEEAAKNYADLNSNYTTAFLDQEKRLDSITKQTNEHLTELKEKSAKQFEEANVRLVDMETVYREKLRLEAPAEYWEKVETDYKEKGTKWLIASGVLAFLIVIGLITFLLLTPKLFSDDNHWFDNLKNSAIITVVASIAIYMLRLTVKMAISSYHLSRDAKERNNLSYFYLALIEEGAVSDKERALILNALFSRSDTGLLKGESAPSMPTNISDIIEILKDK